MTGLVDLGGGSPKFTASIYSFRQSLTVQTAGRQGRSAGRWTKTRAFQPGGTLALSGQVVFAGFPLPDAWKGQEGTITLQFQRAAKQTLSVRVIQADVSLSDKDAEDHWKIALVCLILANPTLEGFSGTQAAATDPTQSDQELYAGLTKTYDPNNLLTGQTVQYDVWPLGDTDSAERTKLASIVATALAAGFSGAKVKTATLEPGRTDDAGVITVALALTDSAEDVVNPITETRDDPQGLQSSATAAAINDTPSTPAGLKVRSTNTRELHDAATLTTREYGLTDTAEDVLNPLNVLSADPKGLQSEGTQAAINATPSTPVGYKLRATETRELNDNKSLTTIRVGLTDTEEDVLNPRNVLDADPEALESKGTQAAINATPSTPAGYKVRSQRTTELNDDKSLTEIDVGLRSTKDDIEYLQSKAGTEPGQIAPSHFVVKVTGSSTPPDSTPLNPDSTNLSYLGADSHQVTDDKWVHLLKFGPLTEQEQREEANTSDQTDPASLEDESNRCQVTSSSTPPTTPTVSGKVCDRIITQRIAKVRWQHRWHYSYRTSDDKLEADRFRNTQDAQGIRDEEVTALVYLVSSGAGLEATTLGSLKLVDKTDYETGNPLYRLRVYRWGRRDSKDEIEQDGTSLTTDPYHLAAKAETTEVYTTGAEPAAPSAPDADLVRVGQTYKTLHDTKKARTTHFDTLTSFQRETFPDTKTTTDNADAGLESSASSANTWTGSPPGAPSAPSGMKLVSYFDRPVTNGYSKRVWIWGTRDSVDDATFPHILVVTDANGIEDREVQAQVWDSTGSEPADPTVPTGLKLRTKLDRPIAFERKVRIWEYGQKDTADDLLYQYKRNETDQSGIDSHATDAAFDAAAPAPPSGLVLVDSERIDVNPDHYVTVGKYGSRTRQQEIEQRASKATYYAVEPDRYTEGTVVACDSADTVQALAAAYRATQLSDPTFDWVSYEKLNPTKAHRVVGRVPAVIVAEAVLISGQQARVSRLGVGGVEVYMQWLMRRGGLWEFRLSPQIQDRAHMGFVLRRRQAAAASTHFDLLGRKNADWFLGLPPGTVAYVGPRQRLRFDIAACRDVDYEFRWESGGIYNDFGAVDDKYTTTYDLSGVSIGTGGDWVGAFGIGLTNCLPPLDGDFSVFLA